MWGNQTKIRRGRVILNMRYLGTIGRRLRMGEIEASNLRKKKLSGSVGIRCCGLVKGLYL